MYFSNRTSYFFNTAAQLRTTVIMKAYYVNADRRAAVETARKARALVEGNPDIRDASIILAELDSIFSGKPIR